MTTISHQIKKTAERFPEQALIVESSRSVTFAEFDQGSDRIAAALQKYGISAGKRVALYCINSTEFALCYAGIIKAGAIVVPVNLLYSPEEVDYVLRDAGVAAVIYHEMFLPAVSVVKERLDQQCRFIQIGSQPDSEAVLSFADLLSLDSVPEPVELDPEEELAAILYTSGTTGFPKGAMLTHHNLLSNTRSVVDAMKLTPGQDRLLVVLPMFHSFAATVGMLTPILHGLSFVPVPKFDPGLISTTIADSGATIFLGVPSMYNVLLKLPDEEVASWSNIRFGVSGGAAMPVKVMQAFEARFGFAIYEGDGPTECSPVTCVNPIDGIRKPASVGLPIPDVAFRICDDAGNILAVDEVGEICVSGPNVMKGYWNRPDETAETFFGEWLRTGDLGYLDGDGYLFIVDRKKDMVIVNGMNVYPRMIEEVLYRHPQIAEAAVVGEPHDLHGETVVAYVVAGGEDVPGSADLKKYCREHLGKHEVPRRFEFMETLPRNAAGKILKRELRRAGEIERGIDQ